MDLFEWFYNWKSTKCPQCSSSFKEVPTHRCTIKCFNIRPQMYSTQVCNRDVNDWIYLIFAYFMLLRFWGVVVAINLGGAKVKVLKGWHIFEDQFGSEHHSDSLYKKPFWANDFSVSDTHGLEPNIPENILSSLFKTWTFLALFLALHFNLIGCVCLNLLPWTEFTGWESCQSINIMFSIPFMHVLPVRIKQDRKNDPKITQLSFPCTVCASALRLHL